MIGIKYNHKGQLEIASHSPVLVSYVFSGQTHSGGETLGDIHVAQVVVVPQQVAQ